MRTPRTYQRLAVATLGLLVASGAASCYAQGFGLTGPNSNRGQSSQNMRPNPSQGNGFRGPSGGYNQSSMGGGAYQARPNVYRPSAPSINWGAAVGNAIASGLANSQRNNSGSGYGQLAPSIAPNANRSNSFGRANSSGYLYGGGNSGYRYSSNGRNYSNHGRTYSSTNRTPQYSSNNRVYRSTPSYTTSSPSYRSSTTSSPSYTVRSTPSYTTSTTVFPSAPKVTYSGEPITIRCIGEQGDVCKYSLLSGSSSRAYSIRPGEVQRLEENSLWKIKYDRGAGWGKKTYRLRGGYEYALKKTDDGWQLYKDD